MSSDNRGSNVPRVPDCVGPYISFKDRSILCPQHLMSLHKVQDGVVFTHSTSIPEHPAGPHYMMYL